MNTSCADARAAVSVGRAIAPMALVVIAVLAGGCGGGANPHPRDPAARGSVPGIPQTFPVSPDTGAGPPASPAPAPPPDAAGPTPPDAAPAPDPTPPADTAQQSGGTVQAVELAGDLAYVGVGPRLSIWDLSDPTRPTLRGQTPALDGVVSALLVAGPRVYLGAARTGVEDGKLHVIDVSDPARPRAVAAMPVDAPRSLALVANQLLVAHGNDLAGKLTVYDLSDPLAPRPLRTIRGGGQRMRLVGSRLYYWGRSFIGDLIVGALDTAADLAEMGVTTVAGAKGADVIEGDLLITTGIRGTQVFDARNIPALVERYSRPDLPAFGLVASGRTAWLPSPTGLYTFDLTAPDQITVSDPLPVPTELHNQSAVQGDRLVVVTERSRLLTLDVATPTAPVAQAKADVSLCDNCLGVHPAGDALAVASSLGGLRTALLPSLAPAGRGHPDGRVDFESLVVVGNLAYVADWFFGLRTYDVSNPAAPQPIFELALQANPSAIAQEDGRLYLGQTTNGGVLWIFDLANPAQPTQLAAVETPQIHDLKVRNRIVYIAGGSFSGEPGLAIVDTTDPAAVTLLGRFPCREAQAVGISASLAGTLAVVGCSDGFHFIDVTDPRRPVRRGGWVPPAPNTPRAVATAGTRAFLGHNLGVQAFDLTDPAAPRELGTFPTAHVVRGLFADSPDHVLAAAGLAGVYQWSLPSD
jgi:hypothetical protein